jgi:hypothetical protein
MASMTMTTTTLTTMALTMMRMKRMKTVTTMMNNIPELLAELASRSFYGALELKYEAGVVVLIRKTETLKPTEPTHRNNRSISHERNVTR